jgi:7-cyano-7-deazaguanine synthase
MSETILLSGGIDSTALAAWRRPTHAITIDYGQLPANGELRAAAKICELLHINHHVIEVDCRSLGSGDMAGGPAIAAAPVSEWWPYRNQLLVTLAAMKAISFGATAILVGSVSVDKIHVDGTATFYAEIDRLVAMQEGSIRVIVPAIAMTSAELVRTAQVDRSLLGWCHSCHVADYACGKCRGCLKHRSVLEELGYRDEILGITEAS